MTPFHFGETIVTDLANYDGTDDKDGNWKGSYGRGPTGIYREETTDVGSFPANAFGLYDMHGNVWEWCADEWRDNYEGAPTDGSAWTNEKNTDIKISPSSDKEEDGNLELSVLRGGSWNNHPRNCRSANRSRYHPGNRSRYDGFRACCSPPRILP